VHVKIPVIELDRLAGEQRLLAFPALRTGSKSFSQNTIDGRAMRANDVDGIAHDVRE
jgi:hypothetical protein